jgi:hypothetical protein
MIVIYNTKEINREMSCITPTKCEKQSFPPPLMREEGTRFLSEDFDGRVLDFTSDDENEPSWIDLAEFGGHGDDGQRGCGLFELIAHYILDDEDYEDDE